MKINPWLALTIGLGSFATAIHCAEMEPEAQKLLGIQTADLAALSLPPETAVFATVISPASLIDNYRKIETAQAELTLSATTVTRLEKLFAGGELVARKELEAAQAQHNRNQAALLELQDRLTLEWGERLANLPAPERKIMLDSLLAGHRALLRLAVSRGKSPTAQPVAARLHEFGQDRRPFRCTTLLPARTTDPAFQATTYLGWVDTPDAPLAVGGALNGTLELVGKPRVGRLVPQSAVVFYLGKAWIYQQSGDAGFNRLEIPADTPVEGGWFISGDVIKPHQIVTQGAQALLSGETIGSVEEE